MFSTKEILSALFISGMAASACYAAYTYFVNTRHPLSDRMGASIIFDRIWRAGAFMATLAAGMGTDSWIVLISTFILFFASGFLVKMLIDRFAHKT